VFRYKALNDQSEYVEGELNLASEQLVLEELLKLGYVPIKIWSDKRAAGHRRLLPRRRFRFEIEPFFENLSDYLDSGLAVDKALELEANSQAQASGAQFLTELVELVRQGGSLSEAMQKFPQHFSSLYVGVVNVGEQTDSLRDSMHLLASLTHDLQEFKQKIKSALVYPAILSAVMLLSILVLFGLVIPRFKSMFVGMGIEMKGITAVVMGISDVFTQHYQLLLVTLLGLVFLGRYLYRSLRTNRGWAAYFLKLPLVGPMIQQYNLYVIAVIMQILMKKKIAIITALEHLRDAIDNIVYKSEIETMTREINRGQSIQQVLSSELFTQHFIYLVGVGEETGRMAEAFGKLARYYYKQLDNRIKSLMTYAEPAIIMVLGLIVGLIVVSMLQAILSINELAV
jgi:general secretion pathway protein F